MTTELCFLCDEPTGRAGRADDSIFCELCNDCCLVHGPFCEDCWDNHKRAHRSMPKVLESLARIVTEATELAKNCPPAPHGCHACEILHIARELLRSA